MRRNLKGWPLLLLLLLLPGARVPEVHVLVRRRGENRRLQRRVRDDVRRAAGGVLHVRVRHV